MNSIDKQYQDLLKDILENGTKKSDRTGTGTISLFGRTIRHKMSDGFPLLTTKKMAHKALVTELLWFIKGDTNIKYLIENNCNIWNGDAYKRYCTEFKKGKAPGATKMVRVLNDENPEEMFSMDDFIEMIKLDDDLSGGFSRIWGDLGPIYGAQWRRWRTGRNMVIGHTGTHNVFGEEVIDQFYDLNNDLEKNPDSRRLMVSAWNPAELTKMVLPPCHYSYQCYTKELSIEDRWEYFNIHSEWDAEIMKTQSSDNDEELHRICDAHNVPRRSLSLMWNQRSVDTFLGLPFNIASYGLLLTILAQEHNMIADELIGCLGDTHLYLNHLDQAKEQITRTPYGLPELRINHKPGVSIIKNPEKWSVADFQMLDYLSHPAIKAPLSN